MSYTYFLINCPCLSNLEEKYKIVIRCYISDITLIFLSQECIKKNAIESAVEFSNK